MHKVSKDTIIDGSGLEICVPLEYGDIKPMVIDCALLRVEKPNGRVVSWKAAYVQNDGEFLMYKTKFGDIDCLGVYKITPRVEYSIGESQMETEGSTVDMDITESDIKRIKNNDGRNTCAWCYGVTKKVDSGFSWYNVCTKCGR